MAGKYPNSGILSRNKNRRDDKDPEFTGSAEVNGREYWLSAWVNDGDKGKYFKISFRPKDEQQRSSGRNESRSRTARDDDDMPF